MTNTTLICRRAISIAWVLSAGLVLGDETILFDDFEKDAKRTGEPEIVSGNVSPGLLVATRMGVYRAAPHVTIEETGKVCAVPAGGRVRFVKSLRVYGFGRTVRRTSWLKTTFGVGEEGRCTFEIAHDPKSPNLVCKLGGKKLEVPYAVLPADFTVSANDMGVATLEVSALTDSSVRSLSVDLPFFKRRPTLFACRTELIAPGGTTDAEVTLDNLRTATAQPAVKTEMPAIVEPQTAFDPDAAGWKKVFEDEFEGSSVDLSRWEIRNLGTDRLVQVKDGVLRLGVDYPAGCTNFVSKSLQAASLWTRESWRYGYFEARVKFTRQNGWWAAFWLYGEENANPFTEGFEIDIFEDYYTRNFDKNCTYSQKLDHNLHMYCGTMKVLKSWNYNSALPTLDDWHCIGCKWTPFEISYYLDGKLIRSSAGHSPWNSVTFDPFNHACGTAPLKAIVSCQVMRATWNKEYQDVSKCVFPDWYQVDRVSVWAYPETGDRVPQVTWAERYPSGEYEYVDAGTQLVFKVDVKPAASGKPLKTVYLFDTGYPLQCLTNAPYVFTVPFTEEYYKTTRYMSVGRQKVTPVFDVPHAFVAFAQDVDGKVGSTEPLVLSLRHEWPVSRPFEGNPHPVPGEIRPGEYDEGGADVAYADRTRGNSGERGSGFRKDEDVDCRRDRVSFVLPNEWLNYSIDVVEEGEYDFTFNYGTPFERNQRVILLLDGRQIGVVPLVRHESNGFKVDQIARTQVHLPAGRHVLRLMLHGTFDSETFSFEKVRSCGLGCGLHSDSVPACP